MRKSIQSSVFSLLSTLSVLFTGISGARASEPVILTPENAVDYGVDYKKAERALADAGIMIQNKQIGMHFHEENSQVDLSSFDGFSIRVDISKVTDVPTNKGESGGGA